MSLIRYKLSVVIFLLLVGYSGYAQPNELERLDSFVENEMNKWEIPGLALGVIHNGEVISKNGFGIRHLGKPDSVNSETVFAIGSVTKSFTAVALAKLVEEKLIHWDDPVIDHLPTFRLEDPWLTQQITIRDLLSHRTGLENNNLLFWGSTLERKDLIRRFRHLRSESGFRGKFLYNNLGYVVAAELISAKTDMTWEAYLKEKIFSRLNMNSTLTVFSNTSAEKTATPHAKKQGQLTPIPHLDLSNAGPAGNIYSNLDDMMTWLRFMLNEGTHNNQEIINPAIIQEMHTPQTLVRSGSVYTLPWPESRFNAYGFGWFIHEYQGFKLVEHGGNTDGMTALIALLPELETGLVILTNKGNTFLPYVLTYEIFNRLTGSSDENFAKQFLTYQSQFNKQIDQIESGRSDITELNPSPPLDLETYVNVYENPLYGRLKIQFSPDLDNELSILLQDLGFKGELQHKSRDTFHILWEDYNLLLMMNFPQAVFQLNARGTPETLKLNEQTYFEVLSTEK